jgi:hypothetical protein
MTDEPTEELTRPKDQSLEAYKTWVLAAFEAMSGKPAPDPDDAYTPEDWAKHHKQYWESRGVELSQDED